MLDISNHTHPEEEALERYSLGKLDESEAAPIEEHLFVCHECQDRLAVTDDYIRTLRLAAPRLKPEPAAKPAGRRFWQIPKVMWVPAMAAVIMVAIVTQNPDSYATQVVELRSYRGAESSPAAESGSLLELKLGMEGLRSGRPYRVDIADASGTKVWYGAVGWKESVATVKVAKPLKHGQYWVRVYEMNPESDVVREYGLSVR
jgi:hypothetical protein